MSFRQSPGTVIAMCLGDRLSAYRVTVKGTTAARLSVRLNFGAFLSDGLAQFVYPVEGHPTDTSEATMFLQILSAGIVIVAVVGFVQFFCETVDSLGVVGRGLTRKREPWEAPRRGLYLAD